MLSHPSQANMPPVVRLVSFSDFIFVSDFVFVFVLDSVLVLDCVVVCTTSARLDTFPFIFLRLMCCCPFSSGSEYSISISYSLSDDVMFFSVFFCSEEEDTTFSVTVCCSLTVTCSVNVLCDLHEARRTRSMMRKNLVLGMILGNWE